MNNETDWAERIDESDVAAERYHYFMSKEPREELGPIRTIDDPYLGVTKVRDVRIGMVRNAAEENKKEVLAYLQPYPHIRIDKAKELQGWYQSLYNESAASRPRPCFTEAILTEPYGGWCAVSCKFSLPAGEPIDTLNGTKSIEDFQIGDLVWGRCKLGAVLTRVTGITSHFKPEGLIRVVLSDGRVLPMTGDHPVYSRDRKTWVNASELREGETLEQLYSLPEPCSLRRENSKETRHPYVVRTEKLPGGVQVYDIQTDTGNFYQRGILVHNCYINSGLKGYRGTGLITVPVNYGSQIRDQLKKMRRSAAGYFSSFTDPFTPLEKFYHNTQEAAQAFVDVGLPVFFLSRLSYPEWAIDLLTRSPYSYAQKSINTPDPNDWRLLSPGALPLEEHFEDIARLKDAGIYVSIQVNPIVPGVTSNEQVIRLFRRLKEAGADHVIVKFVEAGYSWAPAMVERMKQTFGERGDAFEALFTQNIGSQRTVNEEYRLKAHKLLSSYARKFGLTYATCYEYRYERDANGDVLSKTGISIGREYTTAAQCHGQAVPVFTRNSDAESFTPVDVCPPSGCLYCAAENEGEPRCGDALAGEAPAVRAADLKVPIGAGKGRRPESSVVQLGVIKR